MTTAINVSAGLLGVLVGAMLSWLASKRQQKTILILSLHREFNDPAMIRIRYRAHELLRRQDPNDDIATLRKKLGPIALLDVFTIIHFYQRLWLALHYRSIRKTYVAPLFGDIFMWWYEEEFCHRFVPLEWEAALQLRSLYEWLEANSTREQRAIWRRGHSWDDGDVID